MQKFTFIISLGKKLKEKNVLKMAEDKKLQIDDKVVPSIEDLLSAGVHFGHTSRRWHPAMAKYIYKKKGNNHILDVRKTQKCIKTSLDFLNNKLSAGRKNILIVGTKKQVRTLVTEFGNKHALYYISEKWLAGLFTNFRVLQLSLKTLEKLEEEQIKLRYTLSKQELAFRERKIKKLRSKMKGVMFMRKLPDVVIIIDAKYEKIAVKESRLSKIPIIGVVDTNTDPRFITHPIPANDDAIKSIKLFLSMFAEVMDHYRNEKLEKERLAYEKKLELLSVRIESEYKARQSVENMKGVDKTTTAVSKTQISTGDGAIIKVASTSLKELNISQSLINKLITKGIKSVEMLSNITIEELRALPGIGPKTADTIYASYQKYNDKK